MFQTDFGVPLQLYRGFKTPMGPYITGAEREFMAGGWSFRMIRTKPHMCSFQRIKRLRLVGWLVQNTRPAFLTRPVRPGEWGRAVVLVPAAGLESHDLQGTSTQAPR